MSIEAWVEEDEGNFAQSPLLTAATLQLCAFLFNWVLEHPGKGFLEVSGSCLKKGEGRKDLYL